jgi:hypothetical protein
MAIKVITDNKARNVLHWFDLTDKERKEFDYLDTEDKQMEAQFIRYRKEVYDLNDIDGVNTSVGFPSEFAKWSGYRSDSFFSGILIKWMAGYEQVIVGRYYS